jgi:DegV family protein with EDD domain
MNMVIISADRTCDLPQEKVEQYGIPTMPYHINLEDKEYIDNVDITPDDLYKAYWERKALPKTSAISVGEYIDYFKPMVDAGNTVVHLTLGSALSSSYNNCRMAAEEFEGKVFVIDACNLSTGIGLLVLKACELREAGKDAAEIAQIITDTIPKSHASFVLDTLEFMAAGGRCSAVLAFGANLLKLKPSIKVHNDENGAMKVDKKYRGELGKVLVSYVKDQMALYPDIDTSRIFITHSGIDEKMIEIVREELKKYHDFGEILVSRASCTISCHCGPATLGVLFLTK